MAHQSTVTNGDQYFVLQAPRRCVHDTDRSFVFSVVVFFFSSRRRHTRFDCDWSSDVCSSDLPMQRRLAMNRTCRSTIVCVAVAMLLGTLAAQAAVLGGSQSVGDEARTGTRRADRKSVV